MSRISIGIALASCLMLGSCRQKATSPAYLDSIKRWQQHRDAGLRSPNGWLTLVGLFWLQPGGNTIGSADSNQMILPKNSAPANVGKLDLQGDKVMFTNLSGQDVTVNKKPVTGSVNLSYDDENPDVVQAGTVQFIIIKRLDRFGVRAKDSASPVLQKFAGMKYFPINPELHVHAKMVNDPKTVPILNIIGQTEQQESPGVVEFTYKGETYRLRPIYEGKTLFFLYKDPTNKTQTYQAGRMLNTPLPINGRVDLDFNRSYNPPCTFTPYATCPLPPKENTLPFPVEAGELRYGKGHADY